MVSGLSKTLARAGHRVGVVTPLYAGIEDRFSGLSRIPEAFDLPVGPRRITAGILALEAEEGLTIYFVEQPGFYQRAAPYGVNGTDFADNAERFVFFSKAVVELARRLPWRPELIHAHDWQTGLVPLLLLEQYPMVSLYQILPIRAEKVRRAALPEVVVASALQQQMSIYTVMDRVVRGFFMQGLTTAAVAAEGWEVRAVRVE